MDNPRIEAPTLDDAEELLHDILKDAKDPQAAGDVICELIGEIVGSKDRQEIEKEAEEDVARELAGEEKILRKKAGYMDDPRVADVLMECVTALQNLLRQHGSMLPPEKRTEWEKCIENASKRVFEVNKAAVRMKNIQQAIKDSFGEITAFDQRGEVAA